jgi:hypothetical protein
MLGSKRHNLLTAKGFFRIFKKRRPPPSWIKPTVIGLLLVLTAVAVVALPFGIVVKRVYEQAASGKADMLAAQSAAESLQVDEAITRIDSATEKFDAASRELDKLRLFSAIPYVADRTADVDSLLQTGQAVSRALRQALVAGRDIMKVMSETEGLTSTISGSLPSAVTIFRDMKPSQKRQVLSSISSSAPNIKEAIVGVDNAIATFDAIPDGDAVRSVKISLLPIKDKLTKLRAALKAFQPAAEIIPGVLGYPQEKRYLVILTNDTELRPTGGFLSMVGEAVIKDAELASVSVGDVYALDGPAESTPRPPPPEPIKKYIGINRWFLRDANWSPDFTVTAGVIKQFYAEEYVAAHPGEPAPVLDGIITVTPRVAADILRLTGPLTIDGHRFDADNLTDELEFEVEKGYAAAGIPAEQRKNIVGQMLKEMIGRISSFSLTQLVGVADAVKRDLDRGAILLYSDDPTLQRMILNNDWGGKLRPVRGDYLSVIDANLASLKSDPMVSRSIRYSLGPDGSGGFVGKASVTYENRGKFTWKTTRYRTYTRVYVPAGSELIGVAGSMENDKLKDPARRPGKADTGSELGRTYFGAFISIEPGEKKALEFTYKLPAALSRLIGNGAYILDVEKQPGTTGRGLTLDLDFGKKLSSAEPAEDQKEFGDTRFRYTTDLDIDRAFLIGL